MASKVKKNKINFNGKMVHIGIDKHKRFWRITAVVEGDKNHPFCKPLRSHSTEYH